MSRKSYLLAITIIALAYFGLAEIAMLFGAIDVVASIWPSSGIALAALLLLGVRVWPGILLGNLFIEFVYYDLTILNLLPIFSISIGNTLEPLLAAFVLHQIAGSHQFLERTQDLLKFFAAALLGPIASATIGSTSVCLSGNAPWAIYTNMWSTWWISNMVGIIIFTPLLMVWASKPVKQLSLPNIFELALLVCLVIFISWIAFGSSYPVEYILIPFLMWSAFRFEENISTLLIVAISVIAIWGTVNGFGSFVRESQNESLLLLQSFVAIVALTTLVLLAIINERKHAESQLDRTEELAKSHHQLEIAKNKAEVANQAKSTFLANMSHELRSPLNAILGFAQLMSQTLPQEHQENIGIIRRSGEHLLTLINQVLDLSKIEAGRTTLNEQNFDLHCLLDDVHDMFQLKADEKHLQLRLERAPGVPQNVRTDEIKLRQVLINLLNNALKFTQEGGVSLRVDTLEQSENSCRLLFEIEDTGPGIAPNDLDSLFEAFVQTAIGKQAQEGTGLGLPISRKFVQLMGGEIIVSSEIGKGTIFKFEIVVNVVKAIQTQQPECQVIALKPDQPRYRILIVDDIHSNRQLLIKLLAPLGFELQEASNGKEAIEIWEHWQPHLIWMDMRMPVMDGYEATRQIKATTKGKNIAIIALTASVFEEERAVVLSAGCDDFLRKPFRTAEFFDIMHKHIGVNYIEVTDTAPEEENITPDGLRALPRELLTQMQQAAIELDIDLMSNLIEQIRQQNEPLANALAQLAHNFQYDRLSDLIEQAQT